ncbi:hypothetical protein CASFOL_034186 [Castilleja foliolosa]|uniref:Uncharacterized protein n=1 Tax=Castilleja foliolosa TaxID=1961234 RepID=A0ABD3BWU5_9LAMI
MVRYVRARVVATEQRGSVNEVSSATSFSVADNNDVGLGRDDDSQWLGCSGSPCRAPLSMVGIRDSTILLLAATSHLSESNGWMAVGRS